jgi:hypothetical protein
VYFFWAQYITLKLYKITEQAAVNGKNQVKKFATRLGITSFLNLISLLTIAITLTPLFHHQHGWMLICMNSIPLSMVAIAEIKCVPADAQRNPRRSKTNTIGSPADSRLNASRSIIALSRKQTLAMSKGSIAPPQTNPGSRHPSQMADAELPHSKESIVQFKLSTPQPDTREASKSSRASKDEMQTQTRENSLSALQQPLIE